MAIAAGLVRPLSAAIDAKLGRCFKCMRLSAVLTVGSWSLAATLLIVGAPEPLLFFVALMVAALTPLSLAHGIAYVARGPSHASGCVPCAAKAKAQAYKTRRAFTVRKSPASTCTSCAQAPRPLEALSAMAEDLPKADEALAGVLERSGEFNVIRHRLANPEPVDSWQADMKHYFLYKLKSDAEAQNATALFVMSWDYDDPLSGVVITTNQVDRDARMVNLQARNDVHNISVPQA
jgi:hypothetical protein